MDVESVRDWVLIVAGILWGLMTLVAAAIMLALVLLTSRGLGAARGLVRQNARSALGRVHVQLTGVRDRTSNLPGNTPIIEGEARTAPSRPMFRLPFRKRRRRWLPLPR
jgi:hypothetical protein